MRIIPFSEIILYSNNCFTKACDGLVVARWAALVDRVSPAQWLITALCHSSTPAKKGDQFHDLTDFTERN